MKYFDNFLSSLAIIISFLFLSTSCSSTSKHNPIPDDILGLDLNKTDYYVSDIMSILNGKAKYDSASNDGDTVTLFFRDASYLGVKWDRIEIEFKSGAVHYIWFYTDNIFVEKDADQLFDNVVAKLSKKYLLMPYLEADSTLWYTDDNYNSVAVQNYKSHDFSKRNTPEYWSVCLILGNKLYVKDCL